jgi:hypothetical protein
VGTDFADPLLAQGLLHSSHAIRHVGEDDGAPAIAEPLPLGPAQNMASWAGWVRASLYLTDFLKDLGWETRFAGHAGHVSISYEKQLLAQLHRPDMTIFMAQLEHVRNYMDQRGDRAAEILSQLTIPADYYATILGLNASRNPRTLELITVTLVLTAHVTMVAKHHLACRRPDRLGATVMPMLATPGHGTFPSAHAAEAFAIATVLEGLLGNGTVKGHYPRPEKLTSLLYKQAERIAVNRTVAGVHFPIDTWAGAALGEAVGQVILAKCKPAPRTGEPQPGFVPRTYDVGAATEKNGDFRIAAFRDLSFLKAKDFGLTRQEATVPVTASQLFGWLWKEAVAEFDLGAKP